MAKIALYDPTSVIVSDRVTAYLESANTQDYLANPNKLINPDTTNVDGINPKYWKVSGDILVEMTTEEKASVDLATNDVVAIEMDFQISNTNYITLFSFKKKFEIGNYVSTLSYHVCSNRNNRDSTIRLTIGGKVAEFLTYCKKGKVYVPTSITNFHNFTEEETVDITVEAKASSGTRISIHELIFENKEVNQDVSETFSLSV